jgi:hypothetical protein
MITEQQAREIGSLLQRFHTQVSDLVTHIPHPKHRELVADLLGRWTSAVDDLQQHGVQHVELAKAEVEKVRERAQAVLAKIAKQAEELAKSKQPPPKAAADAEPAADFAHYQTIRSELLEQFGKSARPAPRTPGDPGEVWKDWNWDRP